jgi:hypothetical protein
MEKIQVSMIVCFSLIRDNLLDVSNNSSHLLSYHNRDKNAPGKAQSILRLMEFAYNNGSTMVRPDEECYRYVLITAAKRLELADVSSALVDDCLLKMKNSFLVPDSQCYGAAIRTWKNVAINDDVPPSFRDKAARRTLELLVEMNVANKQSLTHSVRATTEHINDVIEALAAGSRTNQRRMDHAERLLTEMEEASSGISSDDSAWASAKPNADTYRLVIDVWKSSDSRDRIDRAKSILRRFHETCLPNMTSVAKIEYNRVGRLVGVFNSFVDLCSTSQASTEEEGMEVLKEALNAIEIMQSNDNLKPNSATYSSLLQGCENVLPKGEERQRLVEMIFRLCCDDGLVDDVVLTNLKSVATTEQYTRMVVAVSEDIDGTRMIPEVWTTNALGGRKAITADGRRTKALCIDGRLTVTRAMQEFKMRRLRDKRNRNLLQGGRLHRQTRERSDTPSEQIQQET